MKENRVTQRQFILQHLKRYGCIEPITALSEYGCYRLGAIIFNLRKDGYNIVTKRINAISNITGRRVMFAKYILL